MLDHSPFVGADDVSTSEGESFDVLLQLTLPIVLILAFVIVTEIRAFENAKNEFEKFKTTPQGEMLRRWDEAVMTLQQQVLLMAVQDTIRDEEIRLGLPEYASAAPTAAAILSGQVTGRFREISDAAYRSYNTDTDARRAMRQRALTSYERRAADTPSLRGAAVSVENLRFFDSQMNTQIDAMVGRVVDVQLRVVLAWIQDEASSRAIQSQSKELFGDLVSKSRRAGAAATAAEFTNLKVKDAQRRLRELGAPLLERAVRAVL